MGSPLTTWEGAEAIFTFADNPFAMGVFLILTLVAIVGAIAYVAKHESDSYDRLGL